MHPFALGPLLAGYTGMLLLGAAFIACGLAASAVTDSQGVSALLTYGVLVLSWFLAWNEAALSERLAPVVIALSLFDRFYGFAQGAIDSRDVAYFVAFIAALPLPRAARARGARLAGRLVRRAVALLVAQIAGRRRRSWRSLLVARRTPPAARRSHARAQPHAVAAHAPGPRPGCARAVTRDGVHLEPGAGDPAADRATCCALYRDAQPLVTVRMLDLDRSPGEAERLGVSNYNVVVLESDGRRERVDPVTEENAHRGDCSPSRDARPRARTWCRVTASPTRATSTERAGLGDAAAALASDGFDVRPLPGAARIPPDAGLVVLAGPTRELQPAEVDALDAYVRGGGRLLVLVDTDAPRIGPRPARSLRHRAGRATSWSTRTRRSSARTGCRRASPT